MTSAEGMLGPAFVGVGAVITIGLMTRYAIDILAALQLARDEVELSKEHQLVGPNVLRSHALSHLYRNVQRGELAEKDALLLLDRITTMRIRLLGDRVSRSVAWKIATQFGWEDTSTAEYLAVAKLQADRFVTLDPDLEGAARSVVTTCSIDELDA